MLVNYMYHTLSEGDDITQIKSTSGLEELVIMEKDLLNEVQVPIEVVIKREKSMESTRTHLLVCAAGIFVFYFVYGILQEKITKGTYQNPDGTHERFTFTLSLVFIQCIINGLFAKIASSVTQTGRDSTPTKLYIICSMTYLGAMLASNHSLQHVAYPTQVLGKSIKPIPVMILGVLMAGKRYPAAKYLCVLMIVTGVGLFMYKDSKGIKKTGDQDHIIGMGEFLLIVSLTLDGLTGASQDKMRGGHQTKSWNMMLNVNLWSQLWLAIGLLVSGELFLFIAFVGRHPTVILKMLSFSVASALGQAFIFLTVTTFGPLMCSIITTTRKFFTILGSVLIFGNPISGRQWIGTILVFIGLGLDSRYGKEKKNNS